MNEQAQQLITDAGVKVLEYLEATEGFAAEQAPLLAQEIVRYGILNSSLQIAFFAVTAPVLLYMAYRFGTSKGAWDADSSVKGVACIVLGGFGVVLALVGLIICSAEAVPNLCKALIAPRLYIIEQISNLF